MPFKTMTKRLGVLTVAAVAALSLMPVTAASAVTVTPAKPSYVTINRTASAGSIQIANGETISVRSIFNLGSSYFGTAPISGATTFDVSWASLATGGLTLQGTSQNFMPMPGTPSSSTTWTYPGSGTAPTDLNVTITQVLKNTTGSSKTVAIDPSTAVLKRDGVAILSVTPIVYASKSVNSYSGDVTSPFTIAANDGHVNMDISLCLADTTGVVAGDAFTVEVTAKKDGTPITVGLESDLTPYDLEFTSSLSGTISSPVNTNMSQKYLSANMSAPAAGTYEISAVLKKGSTVIGGACPTGGGGGGMPSSAFPTTFTKVGTGTGTLAVTGPTSSTINATKLSNSSDFGTGSSVDGNGGEYYWGKNAANKYVLSRFVAGTGVDTKFGGVTVSAGSGQGYIVLPADYKTMGPGPMSFISGVGSYTADASKWLATYEDYAGMSPVYKLIFGTNTAAAVTTKSLTQASLKTICGDAATSYVDVSAVSTPTTVPMVEVECGKMNNATPPATTGRWVVLAKVNVSTGALTAVTTLGSKTTCLYVPNRMAPAPLTVPSVNSGVAAGKQAAIFYAAQQSNCSGVGPTPAKAIVATVKNDGSLGYKKEYTTVASLGLDGITPEPFIPRSLRFAPGYTANEWVAARQYGATTSRVMKVSATGTFTKGGNVTFTNIGDYTNAMSNTLIPLRELSNKTVVFLRLGYDPTNNTQVASIAKVATATTAGAKTLTTGQGIKSIGGASNGRNILNYSFNTKATTVGWFGVMSSTSLKSAKWTLPTS